MDNFNIHKFFKDQYIAEGSCGYTPDGEPRNKPAGPNEAEAIGLSPGKMERGDDGIDAEFTFDDRSDSIDMVIYYTADDIEKYKN